MATGFVAARADAWRTARRVLAVRLDNLGDVLMTTPALQALRQGLPQAHLTLLTSPGNAVLAPHLPMVDAIWTARVPWMPQPGADAAASPGRADLRAAQLGRAEGELIDRLAEGGFDAAVIFTVCTQSALPAALLLRMAGIPLRLAHVRENPYGLLSDWAGDDDAAGGPVRHEVRRQLDLVARVGCTVERISPASTPMRFALRDDDRAAAARRLDAAGLDGGRRYVLLHPGASAPSRRWPPSHFGALARALVDWGEHAVVFAAGAAEHAFVEQALAAGGLHGDRGVIVLGDSASPALTLGELAGAIEGAALVVANNSGPAHLAAALGTPLVCVYAQTNPQHVPWTPHATTLEHAVPCAGCLKSRCPLTHHACLVDLAPERAAQAAFDRLRRPPHTRVADARPAATPLPDPAVHAGRPAAPMETPAPC